MGEFRNSWRVLEPITRRNLTIYPVVSTLGADTSAFLTLDEGVASGQVRILERGQLQSSMVRPRDDRRWPRVEQVPDRGGASVNELVLVNDSAKPLLLLAGEVISGGKQNRIIGADMVVNVDCFPIERFLLFGILRKVQVNNPHEIGSGLALVLSDSRPFQCSDISVVVLA